ncbi:MAG: hypothetical protein MUF81_02330 [Verrucomicrobia bacterium]|nr:hypothetical protein [Verrucomicrobiota bacterium]
MIIAISAILAGLPVGLRRVATACKPGN